MANKAYTIREYQSFISKKDSELNSSDFVVLEDHTFNALEKFILENQNDSEDDAQAWQLLSISVKRGKKVISARNYVGLITMKDGTAIQILPKLENADDQIAIKIFREMLSTVRELPFKSFNTANVKTDKLPLFEVFIKMFLSEVGLLIKRGLKHGYVPQEDNKNYLKGKLDINRQIRNNLLHKERFYVHYDDFEANRPENKLIKSTLQFLKARTKDNKNLTDCNQYLLIMNDIEESKDISGDFARYSTGRNMKEYENIMKWCHIFLQNRSFTSFRGSEIAFALLFPMETLFESYVAAKLKKRFAGTEYYVSAQDKGHYLFEEPSRKFALRPDIVITNNNTKSKIVLDTKWKTLSALNPNNYGISQSDMYQMYAYQKKYTARKVLLIYPYNSSFLNYEKAIEYVSKEDTPVQVQISFVDLLNMNNSVDEIHNMILEQS